jgi:hypothetical protein
MNRKRTTAAGAAVLLGLSTLGGAAALSQASASNAQGDWHVRHFVSKTLQEKDYQRGFVSAETARAHGRVIGYNAISGRFLSNPDRLVVRVGLALRGGVILARATAPMPEEGQDIHFAGPVLGGSGAYDGIHGRVVAVVHADDPQGRAHVTLRWRR